MFLGEVVIDRSEHRDRFGFDGEMDPIIAPGDVQPIVPTSVFYTGHENIFAPKPHCAGIIDGVAVEREVFIR